MIKTTNENIPYYWSINVEATNYNGSFYTDGKDIFSYNLLIGKTESNKKLVYDYTARGLGFVSKTTSKHVSASKNFANIILVE